MGKSKEVCLKVLKRKLENAKNNPRFLELKERARRWETNDSDICYEMTEEEALEECSELMKLYEVRVQAEFDLIEFCIKNGYDEVPEVKRYKDYFEFCSYIDLVYDGVIP